MSHRGCHGTYEQRRRPDLRLDPCHASRPKSVDIVPMSRVDDHENDTCSGVLGNGVETRGQGCEPSDTVLRGVAPQFRVYEVAALKDDRIEVVPGQE
ncbi:MAG: hypothetical protein M3252_07110, partial [Actinomycetota bacterium]|nr:hypothetical protein [Actinomycetota bacterium]